ncbi:1,4-alpha-glucan branching protein GlgB [Eshraghiella crossota]|jgi:1,4-alpha-glucan branching enzyme|uniref:1,4-alpha-glucan branching enzyme GlgB n=3 Tax=Eshraghiella TaxID=3342669 RepID=D4S2X3_9FIRM|nr:1,4-alpha-glucan branching protein GlgB [Butyrivibrio crossotus]EFF67402.1 1,4-alpha-glucan branching enzyme [Butyrivibrio crossotus DSM 2876]UWO50741.1 1,4-alpha-glucan branching protein GlgB [Butyrivibrio crossotus]
MSINNVFLTDTDKYLFGKGTHYEIYEKLGAHITEADGRKGVYFAVWAPNAAGICVVGDFNNWCGDNYEMRRHDDSGIFELFTENAHEGSLYKYLIYTKDGRMLYKADPYATYSQRRPDNASIVYDINRYQWNDGQWLAEEEKVAPTKKPMAIYEVHLGSWKKKDDGTPEGFLNYRESAVQLVDYMKYMGYTHIELMGIAEHPFDGSWGYQVTGYFAPTSRYGTPEDFMYFVDYLHQNGIGVILDWVPAHFPKDEHGLANFDGTPTYEYADSRKGEHPDWGTKIFDYGRTQVISFLISNALYWVEKFHVDGLRVDAVASMLYLDYGRNQGQWVPNKYGGNGNLEAMDFFRHLNSVMRSRNPRAITIAEESTAWPGITASEEEGGLGFTFKWNMGWMHDFLEYMKLDPYFRSNNHNKMTFAMTYAYSENFILVLSHDEVVHLKCSMINKMPGEYEDKFANLKVGYTFMMGHPGKKLLFMGQDFGQWAEWSEAKSLDWHLTNENMHRDLQKYVKSLLSIYNRYKACYELDQDPEGFEWMDPDDNTRSIYSFVRKTMDGRDSILYVCNFTPVARPDFRVGVPCPGRYTLLLNEKCEEGTEYIAEKIPTDRMEYSIPLPLAPYGTAIIKFNYKKVKKPIKKTKK